MNGKIVARNPVIRSKGKTLCLHGKFQREHGFWQIGGNRYINNLSCFLLKRKLRNGASDGQVLLLLESNFHLSVKRKFFVGVQVSPGYLDLLCFALRSRRFCIEADNSESRFSAHTLCRRIEAVDFVSHIIV